MQRLQVLRWRLKPLCLRSLPALACLALGLPGCGANDPDDARALRGAYCQALCGRRASCAPDVSVASCRASCQIDPDFEYVNAQLWGAQIACIDAQTCEAFSTDAAADACFELARSRLIPSTACVEFCQADAAASFECGVGHSVQACVDGPACTFRDAVLSAAHACNQLRDCGERATCLSGALGP